MHKLELDHLLETAVADALGLRLPRRRMATPRPRHIARAPKRIPPAARELRRA